jgi:cytochrome c oxidase subunit 2
MRKPRTKEAIALLLGLYLLGAFALAGCNKTSADAPTAGVSDQREAGKRIFSANRCANCHTVDDASAAPGRKGPNLAKVGADPAHTREWLADHVRDPQKHKPQSRMPKFAGKIKEEDLQALADYLSSLK